MPSSHGTCHRCLAVAARVLVFLIVAAAFCPAAAANSTVPPGMKAAPGYSACYVPPPSDLSTQAANFQIDWTAAGCPTPPAGAVTALAYASTIWGSLIVSPVPIRVSACWSSSLSSNTLATGAPATYGRDFPGAPMVDTYYAISLANAIAGQDLAPGAYHINLEFNASVSWSYATSGPPGVGQYDFVTVGLHELAHGLGFLGWMNESSNVGFCGTGIYYNLPCPTPYDRFAVTSSGIALLSYLKTNPITLGTLLKSDANLGGPNGRARNANAAVKLYTPGTWGPESYTHVDPQVAGGLTIMKSTLAAGEREHSPSQPELGVMRDLGWLLAGADPYITMTGLMALRMGHSAPFTATLVWPAYTGQAITYTWSPAELAQVSHSGQGQSDSAAFAWQAPGVKTVPLLVTGASLSAGTTRAVLVFDTTVDGPTKGDPGATYAFNAGVLPNDAKLPVSYRWQATGQADVVHNGLGTSDSVSWSWSTLGSKAITVTATIAGEPASASLAIAIGRSDLDHFLFLPLVLRVR
jgi:hypothetical protein